MAPEILIKTGDLMIKHSSFAGGMLKTVFLAAAIFLLFSCSAKKANADGTASKSEMTKAFADAGVLLLKQTVPLRDFSLPLLSTSTGTAEIQKLSDLKGKVVFLNFWATWCGPCRIEMPSMENLYSRYRDRGLEMLAVNCMEKEQDVLAFMKENKFSFPVVLDNEGKAGNTYGIQAIPTTFLIDREGNIIIRLVGSIEWDTPKFQAALDLLLSSQ